MNTIVLVTILLLWPLPLFHILLHASLPFWRQHPKALYVAGGLLWLLSLPVSFYSAYNLRVLFTPLAWLSLTSLAVIFAALTVVGWAIFTLGPKRFFVWAVVHPGSVQQTYVRAGPYRFLPHPAYTAYVLASIFLFLGTGLQLALFFLIYFAVLIAIVMHLENRELQKRLHSSRAMTF